MEFDFEISDNLERADKTLAINDILDRKGGRDVQLNAEELRLLEENKEMVFGMKDSVIFLVDAQSLHFVNDQIEQTNIEILIDAYTKLMKRKVVFRNADKVGMVVYNNTVNQTQNMAVGVDVVDPLDFVSSQKILNAPLLQNNLNTAADNIQPKCRLREVSICILFLNYKAI